MDIGIIPLSFNHLKWKWSEEIWEMIQIVRKKFEEIVKIVNKIISFYRFQN